MSKFSLKINYLLKIAISVGLLWISLYGCAQVQVVKSEKIDTINGKQYYIHTVEPGQTLYSVSKAYGIPGEEIIYENPGAGRGLQAGQTLKIPRTSRDVEIDKELKDASFDFIYHIVKHGETIQSIADLYSIAPNSLLSANPLISMPLVEGQYIKVPVSGFGGHKEFAKCKESPDNLKDTYHVALMVPLYLDRLEPATEEENEQAEAVVKNDIFRFIPFYQGFLLAVDSLKKQGLNLELHVYDVDQQTSKAIRAVESPEMGKMDLIVGPMFRGSFTYVANFARLFKIPIVNPFSQHEDILTGYPGVFKIMPPIESQAEQLAELILKRFSNSTIILVKPDNIQYKEELGSIQNTIEDLLHGKNRVIEVNFAADSMPGVRRKLSANKPNLIISYSENEVLPVLLTSRLSELKDSLDITLIGLPEWEKFEQLEVKDLIKFKTIIFSASFTDYGDPDTRQFVMSYRSQYSAEPSGFAYTGFDVAYYFLGMFMRYGRDFETCLDSYDVRLPNTRFKFDQVTDGGFENEYWNIYHYENYKMLRIDHP